MLPIIYGEIQGNSHSRGNLILTSDGFGPSKSTQPRITESRSSDASFS